MATATEQIYTALNAARTDAEREKIGRRLPPESGLEPIGVRMKDVFDTAKAWSGLPPDSVSELLSSRWYEMRMVGVAVLDFAARRRGLSEADRRALYETYLNNHERISVWDLVDRAAPRVVGWYLADKSRQPLFDLARSGNALERRTAITAAFWFVRQGDLDDTLALAELLLDDPSELVTKPVGTALREVGKIDEDRLVAFLRRHRDRMAQVTVRMATERLPDDARAEFVRGRLPACRHNL